jgi:hypothetical protein
MPVGWLLLKVLWICRRHVSDPERVFIRDNLTSWRGRGALEGAARVGLIVAGEMCANLGAPRTSLGELSPRSADDEMVFHVVLNSLACIGDTAQAIPSLSHVVICARVFLLASVMSTGG